MGIISEANIRIPENEPFPGWLDGSNNKDSRSKSYFMSPTWAILGNLCRFLPVQCCVTFAATTKVILLDFEQCPQGKVNPLAIKPIEGFAGTGVVEVQCKAVKDGGSMRGSMFRTKWTDQWWRRTWHVLHRHMSWLFGFLLFRVWVRCLLIFSCCGFFKMLLNTKNIIRYLKISRDYQENSRAWK